MERGRYKGICTVAPEGKVKWVENLRTHEAGRVLSCDSGTFEVEAVGHREQWNPEECKEKTYGYRPVYDEE